MRILILSDSHGNIRNMKLAVERTKPDQIIHLGGYYRDGEALKEAYPLLPVAQVIGNCDLYDFSARGGKDQLILTLDGHRDGSTLLTPGSIGGGDFAVVETDDGKLRCALLHLS